MPSRWLCGICGSGITAEEKFKKLKDGGVNRHVYYGCSRSRDMNCPRETINESDLLKELLKLMDEISLDKIGMRKQLDEEVARYHKFQKGILGIADSIPSKNEGDIRKYAGYILREGTIAEKRELLSHLKSRIILQNRKIRIEPQRIAIKT